MTIRAQGTLAPRNETELVAEAGGRVVWLSPSFDGDGSFAAGEVLVRLAADDYEIAAERARAAHERAESQHALARAALARSDALIEAGAVSPAAHEQASANERIAAANARDAEAALRQAELDLARTRIRAPFAGRVRSRSAAIGQFLARGTPVARVYAAEGAEVELALSSEDAAFLALPSDAAEAGPRVVLSAEVGGETRSFTGRIVRSAGALDPRTRMLGVVARLDAEADGAAAIGAFVEAEIEGRELADVVRLPRSALIGEGRVAVVDADSRLALREVEVLRVDAESVWIARGLAGGERVCTHAPSGLAAGALVRVESPGGAAPPASAAP
jgi:RND family efflux transporter MFP subunit